jgi:hypothetical protein
MEEDSKSYWTESCQNSQWKSCGQLDRCGGGLDFGKAKLRHTTKLQLLRAGRRKYTVNYRKAGLIHLTTLFRLYGIAVDLCQTGQTA